MLHVIGTGFGRTGTDAARRALAAAGIGPCMHMGLLSADPGLATGWLNALRSGRHADLAPLVQGYAATMDWPAAFFWRQLARIAPAALFVHTTRDPEDWYDSMARTVCARVARPLPPPQSPYRDLRLMLREMLGERLFYGRLMNRRAAIARFRAHEREVRETLPAHRLLIWNVADGPEPLNAFLAAHARPGSHAGRAPLSVARPASPMPLHRPMGHRALEPSAPCR